MSVTFRLYTSVPGITEDYRLVRDFLVRRGYQNFTYARWDWMTTHGCLDKSAVGNIGLWLEDGAVVGAALFDCQMGDAFCVALPGHEALYSGIIAHAERHLTGEDGEFALIIPNADRACQRAAADAGYVATPDTECDAAFFADQTPIDYALPQGYTVTDMQARYDLYEYGRVLWKGFNHEMNGEGAFSPSVEDGMNGEKEMLRPHVDLSLKVAVVAPDGHFAGYCGMWYDENAGFAVVEPVAVDPDHRLRGVGLAAVLEGVRRVAARGAKIAVVGSNQPFYYHIGFRPYAVAAKWVKRTADRA